MEETKKGGEDMDAPEEIKKTCDETKDFIGLIASITKRLEALEDKIGKIEARLQRDASSS